MRTALRLIGALPLRLLHALGSVLGWTLYGMSPTYRRHLRENLAAAGYANDARVRRSAIAAAGQMIAELPALWFRPHEDVVALVKEVQGADLIFAELKAGRPILFLTPHMGAFEVSAQYAALHMPITVLYRRPKAAWLEPLMREGRGRANVRLVPADLGGVREMFAALKRGEAAG
ncbi:MAG TPA: lysophospholipid acyltransferase family protein, partial [Burkholderiales bacterium]